MAKKSFLIRNYISWSNSLISTKNKNTIARVLCLHMDVQVACKNGTQQKLDAWNVINVKVAEFIK